MKKFVFVAGCCLMVTVTFAQTINQKLQKAFQRFEKDSQLRHAISSLYVINAKTGKVVFDKNSQIGLAPASTLKIITSVTAFELLGKDYRFKTELGFDGKIVNEILEGNLYLLGTGDPTLGSWRWTSTKDTVLLNQWVNDVKKRGIKKVNGTILFDWGRYSYQSIPDGWIWQDLGNYYGAGAEVLNWKENQLEIILKSGNTVGSKVNIISPDIDFVNEMKTEKTGSGDNAYVYLPFSSKKALINGTIPVNESGFKISASDSDPVKSILLDLGWFLTANSINTEPMHSQYSQVLHSSFDKKMNVISTHYSPSLDSIIYWFNKKSINLYGEALIKTFAYEMKGFGSTASGVAIVKDFWKQKGIDEHELNISDGSGLSPQNRVTTHAQVEILKYAKAKDWFPSFYNSLPEYNGMTMKSGTIKDVKGFSGYHKAKDGTEYIFSFLVNNYYGSASGLVNKMYKLLDVLK
ncbi:MAG: D-alanyl-D-alanine carboxypeptidase/D-alanyl-D-alanine endopeptidase [Chitinophagaceae bacterium]